MTGINRAVRTVSRTTLAIRVAGLGLALALAAEAARGAESGPSDWALHRDVDGIRVWTRPVAGSPIDAYRGEAEVEAPFDDVVALISDAARYPRWFPDCPEARALSRDGDVELRYAVTAAPWPVQDRDVVLRMRTRREGEDRVVITLESAPDAHPVQSGRVRVRRATGRWEIERLAAAAGTRVRVEMHLEPAGAVPGWLVNRRIVETPLRALRGLRSQLAPRAAAPPTHPVVFAAWAAAAGPPHFESGGRGMSTFCEDRVVVVTGAGRGIGREYALMLAEHGAKVVVNDLGGARDGEGADAGPADEVVEEIRSRGGEAVANGANVADFGAAREMIRQAVDTYGRLDALVNNAGILRDRMLVNMQESEWDAVIHVHMKGTFAPAHHAAAYWREQSKAGNPIDARLVNTTSVSGIYGNAGQTNYGAAKAGIAAFSVIASRELGRYGVTVNCIAPGALTRLTEDLQPGEITEAMREAQSPRWVAPIVTWLVSRESRGVTGRVFEASGRVLAVAEGWHRGPTVEAVEDPTTLGPIVRKLVGEARLNAGMNGQDLDGGLLDG